MLWQVERVGQQQVEIDEFQNPLVRGLQENRRRMPGLVGLQPAHGTQAPAVTILQPRECIGRNRGAEIVTLRTGEFEAFARHPGELATPADMLSTEVHLHVRGITEESLESLFNSAVLGK